MESGPSPEQERGVSSAGVGEEEARRARRAMRAQNLYIFFLGAWRVQWHESNEADRAGRRRPSAYKYAGIGRLVSAFR